MSSRILTHTFLAAMLGVSVLLILEWVIPGAVTTIIPLYLVSAGALVAPLLFAFEVREAPLWKRFVGVVVPLIPVLVLGGAFAWNERTGLTIVAAGMTVLLASVLLLAVGFDTDGSTS